MSIQAVAWALELDLPDAGAKLVLVALANRAEAKTGECYPPIGRLAKEASASERTVQRKIALLVEWGLVERRESFAEEGRQRANAYTLRLDRDGIAQDLGGGCQAVTLGEGVTCVTPEGVTPVTPEGVTAVTPLKETIISNHHNNKPAAPAAVDVGPDFGEMTELYFPRDPRDNVRSARDAWDGLTGPEQRQAVDRAKAFCQAAKTAEFIPYLATYLRDRLWLSAAAGAAPVACEYILPGSARWGELVTSGLVPERKMHLSYIQEIGREAFVYYPQRKYK